MKKKAVLLCIAAVIVSVFFSFACAAKQSSHDCEGEDCAICQALEFCTDQKIRNVLILVFVQFSAAAFLERDRKEKPGICTDFVFPVFRFERMNN